MKILFLSLIFLTQNIYPEQNVVVVKKIRDLNMQMFGWEWNYPDTESFSEYLKWHLDRNLNPTPHLKRSTAFKFLKKYFKNQATTETVDKRNFTTWENLDLFCNSENVGSYVAQAMDRTKTEVGTVTLFYQLTRPTTNINLLTKRQDIIKEIIKNQDLHNNLNEALEVIQKSESTLLSLWRGNQFKNLVKEKCSFTLPGTNKLNSSPLALLFRNIFFHSKRVFRSGMSSVAALVLISYGIFHAFKAKSPDLQKWANDYKSSAGYLFPQLWKIKTPWLIHSLVAIFAGYTCANDAKESIVWTKDMFLLEKTIQILVNKMAQYFRASENLYNLIKTNPTLSNFEEFNGLTNFFEQEIKNSKDLIELIRLSNSAMIKKSFIVLNKGIAIRIYQLISNLAPKLENMIYSIGKIDLYNSCANLYQEYESKRIKFCFPEFAKSTKPFIKAENFWHPLIDNEKVVPNSIIVGTENHRPNIILTGPNAGGKSCILKAVTLSLLIGQTLGIAPASSLTFTPFSFIATYLNITDDVNKGHSLFKAEVLRAQGLINRVQYSKPGEFIFTIFDEVFNGTTPTEGAASAYGVAKHLESFSNSISLIATHFSILTSLEKNTDVFSNYKISVNKSSDGKISYPFTLEKGASNQHVAIDILKNEGFSGSIIQEAEAIMASISLI